VFDESFREGAVVLATRSEAGSLNGSLNLLQMRYESSEAWVRVCLQLCCCQSVCSDNLLRLFTGGESNEISRTVNLGALFRSPRLSGVSLT
jgi:hypothetical protein